MKKKFLLFGLLFSWGNAWSAEFSVRDKIDLLKDAFCKAVDDLRYCCPDARHGKMLNLPSDERLEEMRASDVLVGKRMGSRSLSYDVVFLPQGQTYELLFESVVGDDSGGACLRIVERGFENRVEFEKSKNWYEDDEGNDVQLNHVVSIKGVDFKKSPERVPESAGELVPDA